MLEVDTLFNVVKDYHYENLDDFDTQHCETQSYMVQSAAPFKDGNFVVVNCRDTIDYTTTPINLTKFHPRLTAYTPSGNILWDTTFISYAGYEINQMVIDDNGNIYCVGRTRRSDRSYWLYGAFFLKMTKEGEVIFLRSIFPDHNKYGDSNFMINVEPLSDGGLLASGAIDMGDDQGSLNNWLIRLDSNGCITPGCSGEDILLSTSNEEGIWQSLDQVPFILYPNPTQGEVHLRTDFTPDFRDYLIWSDQVGRTVLRQSLLSDRLQTLEAPSRSGLYFLTLYRDGLPIHTEKVMVE
jgi:hypothetical protein